MSKRHSITHISTILASLHLCACATINESLRVKESIKEPSLRLTLAPTQRYETGKSITILAKVSDIKSRALLRQEDTQHLTLIALDAHCNNVHITTPTPSQPSGLYHFTLTPNADAYRVWAAVQPVGNAMEHPYTNLGNYLHNQCTYAESQHATHQGIRYEMQFDQPLTRYSTSAIHITNRTTRKPVPILRLIGFYSDFRHIFTLNAINTNAQTPINFSPQFSGHIIFFAEITTPAGPATLRFTATISDD